MEEELTLDATMAQGAELISQSKALSGATEPPKLPGYSLQSRLGAGTFGEAWAGVQQSTGQKVAVKIFSRHQAMDWELFRAEVQRLMEVAEHPNVVTLLDANLENTPPFFVMPLLSGSLGEIQATPDQLVIWLEEICRGLSYIHSKGILHGDLKPANLLLDGQGRLRLADFGQSFATQSGGYNLGTLGYMPPEQILRALDKGNADPSAAWDIYALGATAYRLLTGQVPRLQNRTRSALESYTMKQRLQFAFEVSQNPLCPLRELAPQVDSELAAIIEGCLEPLSEFRYASADEVLTDLSRRQQQLPLNIKLPWSPLYRGRLFVKRNPRPFAVGVTAVLLLMGTISLAWRQLDKQQAQLSQREEKLRATEKQVEDSKTALNGELARFGQLESTLGSVADSRGNRFEAMLWWAQALQHDPESKTLGDELATYHYPLTRYEWGPPAPTSSLEASADAQVVALAGQNGQILVWQDQHRQQLALLPEVTCLAVRPDGKELAAAGSSGQVMLWRKQADGNWISAESHWLAEPGSLLTGLPPARRVCRLLGYSPDGSRLLAASQDGHCKLFPGGASFQIQGTPSRVSWSQDGKKLLLSGREISLWDASPLRLSRTASGQQGCLSPNGKRILRIDKTGQAVESDLTGQTIRSLGPAHQIAYCGDQPVCDGWLTGWSKTSFSADGGFLAVNSGRRLQVFDVRSHQAASSVLEHSQQVQQFTFSADGQRLVSSDGNLRVFDNQQAPGWKLAWSVNSTRMLLKDGRVAVQQGTQAHVLDVQSGRSIQSVESPTGAGWSWNEKQELDVSPRGPTLSALNSRWLAEGKRVSWVNDQGEIESRECSAPVLELVTLGTGYVAVTRRGLESLDHRWLHPIQHYIWNGPRMLVVHRRTWTMLAQELAIMAEWQAPFELADIAGDQELLCATSQGECQLWSNFDTGYAEPKLLATLKHRLPVKKVALSRDSRAALSLDSEQHLHLWLLAGQPKEAELPTALRGPQGPIEEMKIADSGSFFLRKNGKLEHWTLSREQVTPARVTGQIQSWTGARLDSRGRLQFLDPDQWSKL
ncbi:protein kinase [bacterium]|nr:protein kinase [bacterium]